MNTFGRVFRIHILGESHGECVGVVIDGCPPGIELTAADFTADIERRKAGAKGTTPRVEDDMPLIKSGVFNNRTTGAPITILFENKNTKPQDYNFNEIPRPGHADFTANIKYKGYNDYRGGGHFSGRLTLALVAAGVVAKKIVPHMTIHAEIMEIGGSRNIEYMVQEAIKNQDSVGGVIECTAENVPAGLGEPFFDSVESVISHLAFAIPGIKGIEFGSGFWAANMKGSEHNDVITDTTGKTLTNYAGGIVGGITNSNNIVFRLAVKPTSSIAKAQTTVNIKTGTMELLNIAGRHDACIALRMPVIAEAITAIALADFALIQE